MLCQPPRSPPSLSPYPQSSSPRRVGAPSLSLAHRKLPPSFPNQPRRRRTSATPSAHPIPCPRSPVTPSPNSPRLCPRSPRTRAPTVGHQHRTTTPPPSASPSHPGMWQLTPSPSPSPSPEPRAAPIASASASVHADATPAASISATLRLPSPSSQAGTTDHAEYAPRHRRHSPPAARGPGQGTGSRAWHDYTLRAPASAPDPPPTCTCDPRCTTNAPAQSRGARGPKRGVSPAMPPTPVPSPTTRLDQIPRDFVLERLHELAPRFWGNEQDADVHLVIPMQPPPAPPRANSDPCPAVPPHPQPARSNSTGAVPATSWALHHDYLVPQSELLRTVLYSRQPPTSPEMQGCQVLMSSSHRRSVYVPLPDPASAGVLFYWLYFGDVAALEGALASGAVSWRGLICNVDYLGLDARTKRVVGRWWRRWVKTETRDDPQAESDDDADPDAEDRPASPWLGAAHEGQPPPTPHDTDEVSSRLGAL